MGDSLDAFTPIRYRALCRLPPRTSTTKMLESLARRVTTTSARKNTAPEAGRVGASVPSVSCPKKKRNPKTT